MSESNTTSNDYISALNDDQRTAVKTTDGPLLIIAGAGAGKTRTLTHRIRHLMAEGVDSERILAITFTNKAAGEMRNRVAELMRGENPDTLPFVSTFHALGVHILREFGTKMDIPRHFTIYDRQKSKRAVKEAIKEEGLDTKQWKAKKLLAGISHKKGEGITVEEHLAGAQDYYNQILGDVWRRYEATLKEENALDFDDLLFTPLRLLKQEKKVREHYQRRWQYVHIDEYQDTNRVQYQLARILTAPENNLCVVGDADQTIYTWRGAKIQNILDFENDFPGATTVRLEKNYRSTKTILQAAHDVISKNNHRREKKLYTDNEEGDPIDVTPCYTAAEEARHIAGRTQELIADGVSPHDIAVLYRTNFQSRVLEDAFLTYNVPYHILGTRFFERKEIRDALSYVRLGLNSESRSDLKRIIDVPKRGIGAKTLERMLEDREDELSAGMRERVEKFRAMIGRIGDYAKTKKPSNVIAYVLKETGMKKDLESGGEEEHERLENLKELVSLAVRYDDAPNPEGIEQLLEDAALMSDQDNLNENAGGVRLMTVHAAKGLEFDHVFISGLEQGLFPQDKESESVEEAEEERRLMYVALTRARKQVHLSYASTRMIYGSKEVQLPSEFLDDIDNELMTGAEEEKEETVDLLEGF